MEGGDTVPILADEDFAKSFKRHVMEVVVLQDYEIRFDQTCETPFPGGCVIIAGEDLSRFCWALLVNNGLGVDMSSRLTLAVEIRHDMIVSTLARGELTDIQTHSIDEACNGCDASSIYTAAAGDFIPESSIHRTTDQQIGRLLEPLRRLHSVQAVHIEGPISEQYKASLSASICRAAPTDQELFDAAFAIFEDAMATYEANDFPLAIAKMERTLDAMYDYKAISPSNFHFHFLSPVWDTYKSMKLTLWINLGFASLETGADVGDAYNYSRSMHRGDEEDVEYWHTPPMGHDIAMLFYLWAKVWEAMDESEEWDYSQRSFHLPQVIAYLREGLRHEPSNKIIAEQLRRREAELRFAEEAEAMMDMWDPFNEPEIYAPEGWGHLREGWDEGEDADDGEDAEDGEDDIEDAEDGEDDGEDADNGEDDGEDADNGEDDGEDADDGEDNSEGEDNNKEDDSEGENVGEASGK